MAMNVKKGDTVIVLSGKDKGKQGKVLGTVPSEAKVVVEGINMVTCHVKPRKQGEQGGIVKAEGAIYASKVMPVCPKCGKAVRVGSRHYIECDEGIDLSPKCNKGTRIAHKIENGKKTRVCKHCGAEL